MYQIGAREIVEKILPVVDNFERGLAMIPEEEKKICGNRHGSDLQTVDDSF